MTKKTSDKTQRIIQNTNEIKGFIHCGLCLAELGIGVDEAVEEAVERLQAADGATGFPKASPSKYARISVGFTELGIQVWCVRHDVNVIHIDFEGRRHPANQSRKT